MEEQLERTEGARTRPALLHRSGVLIWGDKQWHNEHVYSNFDEGTEP